MKSKTTNKLIAPCGMNCALCLGFQREKNKCNGCNGADKLKLNSCRICSITKCVKSKKIRYCFECDKLPCTRMKQLDKRYRTKYGMSMIENLEYIKKYGIRKFINQQNKKWKCKKCNSLLCVHRDFCLNCGKK